MSGNEAYSQVNSLELLAVFLGFAILIVSAGVASVHRRKK